MAGKNKSIGDKLKNIAVDTAKGTAKDLLALGIIVGPGKAVKGAQIARKVGGKVIEKAVKKAASKPAVVKTAIKGSEKIDNYRVNKMATNITKQSAREKEIVRNMQAEYFKSSKKAEKIIAKAVKKNPNLFKGSK